MKATYRASVYLQMPKAQLFETKMRQEKNQGERRTHRRREKRVQGEGMLESREGSPVIARRYHSLVSLYNKFTYFSTHSILSTLFLSCPHILCSYSSFKYLSI